MVKGTLSATNLAVHHHLNCDLYLHNVYHGERAVGSVDAAQASSSLLEAQFSRGLDWEKCLLTWLDEKEMLLTIPDSPIDGATFYEHLQSADRDHFYVSGLNFFPPREHLEKRFLDAGTDTVKFGIAKPDLVEIKRVNGGFVWKVIDAKASGGVKVCVCLPSAVISLKDIPDFAPCPNLLLHSLLGLSARCPSLSSVGHGSCVATTR